MLYYVFFVVFLVPSSGASAGKTSLIRRLTSSSVYEPWDLKRAILHRLRRFASQFNHRRVSHIFGRRD